MDKSVQEEAVREDANEEGMGSCNRSKRRICAKEGESISAVKRRKRRGKGVYSEAIEDGVHPAIKIITNGAGVLCRKERWEEKDGVRL